MNHFDNQQTNRFTSPDMANMHSYHQQVTSPTYHHTQTSAASQAHNPASSTHTPSIPTSNISTTSAVNALNASNSNHSLPWSNDPIYEINDTDSYLEDPTLPVPHRKTFFYHPNMKLKTHTSGKPPYSYATLITYAIMQSANKQMSLNEIYQWMMDHYSYLKTAGSGWKNSVRHNLSLNKAFVRVARPVNEPGKGSYWTVDLVKAEEANFKSRNRGLRRGSDSVLGMGPGGYMGIGGPQSFISDVQRRNSMFPHHQPPHHGGLRTPHHSEMPLAYGQSSSGFPFASSSHQPNSLPSILNDSTQSWGSQGAVHQSTSPYDATGLTRSLPQPFMPPQSYFSHPQGTATAPHTQLGSPGPVNFGMVKGTTPGYVGVTGADNRHSTGSHHHNHHTHSASYNPTNSATQAYYGGLSHAAM